MNRTAIAISTGLVALCLAASFLLERGLWGLAAWGAVSPLAALAAAAILVPQFFRPIPADFFRRIPAIRPRALRIAAVAAASILCFRLLGARHDLWGERITLASALEHGRWLPAGPLSTLVRYAAHRFLNAVFLWGATETIALFAVCFGTLYVFAARLAAARVFPAEPEREVRPLATAFLLANGFVAVFLGGGNAAVATLLALLFLVSSLELARGERSLALPSTLFAAAILSHVSAVYLLPAFVYAAAIALRSRAGRTRSLAALAVPAAAWLLFEAAGAALRFATPARFLLAYVSHAAAGLPRGGAPAAGGAALDALNAFLIVGPASVAAAVLLLRRPERSGRASEREPSSRERRMLALAAAGGLALVAASARGIDGGLRWHVIASAGPAFSLFALWTIRRRAGAVEDARRAVSTLFLAGVFHVLPLALLGTVPKFAERRVRALPLAPGRAEMILAEQAEDTGDRAAAKRWYEASLAVEPSNGTAERRLGDIAMKEEEYPVAITHYLNAHELAPADARGRLDLAEALIGNRWFPEAIAHLETLAAAYPESAVYWRRLGFARNNGNRYEGAVAAYERALSLEPDREENVRNLASALLNRAAELQMEMRYDDARRLYDRVIALYPQEWRSWNNLALMEMDLGNDAKAEEMLKRSLTLHAYEPALHTSMGLVLEKQGRLVEALRHLHTSADFDPLYSTAPRHIERIERKLGTAGEAQGDSQRSPLRSP
jgi:tetratricopeptide (TPR) repeat protein